jgi:hypothetical protein
MLLSSYLTILSTIVAVTVALPKPTTPSRDIRKTTTPNAKGNSLEPPSVLIPRAGAQERQRVSQRTDIPSSPPQTLDLSQPPLAQTPGQTQRLQHEVVPRGFARTPRQNSGSSQPPPQAHGLTPRQVSPKQKPENETPKRGFHVMNPSSTPPTSPTSSTGGNTRPHQPPGPMTGQNPGSSQIPPPPNRRGPFRVVNVADTPSTPGPPPHGNTPSGSDPTLKPNIRPLPQPPGSPPHGNTPSQPPPHRSISEIDREIEMIERLREENDARLRGFSGHGYQSQNQVEESYIAMTKFQDAKLEKLRMERDKLSRSALNS